MRKAKDTTIKIAEDVRIPGTDIILEKGDIIRVSPLLERIDDGDLYDEFADLVMSGKPPKKAASMLVRKYNDVDHYRLADILDGEYDLDDLIE